jgi:hypothetical protein
MANGFDALVKLRGLKRVTLTVANKNDWFWVQFGNGPELTDDHIQAFQVFLTRLLTQPKAEKVRIRFSMQGYGYLFYLYRNGSIQTIRPTSESRLTNL